MFQCWLSLIGGSVGACNDKRDCGGVGGVTALMNAALPHRTNLVNVLFCGRNRRTMQKQYLKTLVIGLSLFVVSGLSTARAAELNKLTPAEKRAGWKLLFDGKNLDHWRNYRSQTIGSGWKVVDGALTRAAQGAGDIITVEQYDSFELSLEFKISKGGNSGLMYHVLESDKVGAAFSGPEIQIQDNVDGHDPQKCGWLYQLYPSSVDATRPAGQWNQLRIRITPEQCSTHMNGLRYARYVKGSADWKKRVAKSKFAKFTGFGEATKGPVSYTHLTLPTNREV